jgi:hypothetical protein
MVVIFNEGLADWTLFARKCQQWIAVIDAGDVNLPPLSVRVRATQVGLRQSRVNSILDLVFPSSLAV